MIFKMDAAWASTMAAATATSRREEGFWVWLNTGAGGGYRTGDTVVGEAVGPDEVATCPLPLRPDDNVGNPITAGSYPVAQFHTHPPQFWSKIGRWAGPSRSDKNRAKKDEVPGLVYDYVGDRRWIPAGHPLDAPAKVYLYGLERRSTPE